MIVFDKRTGVPKETGHLVLIPLGTNILCQTAGYLGHRLAHGFKADGVVGFLRVGIEKITIDPVILRRYA
jgi:hypothetical protein